MPKTYVTFCQDHTHRVNGITVDADCVAVIECKDAAEGRDLAFNLFGPKFCFEYHEACFDMGSLRYYPRGLVEVS